MPSARKRDFGRVLIVLAIVLVGVFIAFDLSRTDSVLRAWSGTQPLRVRVQDLIDAVRRSR